jgi:RimJ/RimL family protein N-acetyltransferase
MMAQVNLRPVTEADLTQIVIWRNDPEVMQFMGREAGETTLEGLQEWLARVSAPDSLDHEWMIEVKGRAIGGCGLQLESNEQVAYLGIYIGDKIFWGKGYGPAVIREALHFGFDEEGLHRVHLSVYPENPRAVRCYEKCGFRQEGLQRQARLKAGRWRDLITMAILREEWEALQAPPKEGEGVSLTEFRLTDYEQVSALWQRVGLGPRPSDRKEEVAKKLARDPDLFLVAWQGASVIGSVIGGWDGRRGYIYRMAVHPDYQRRGVGRRLIEELEKRFRSKGVLAVNLTYNTDNTRARDFYRSLGYGDRNTISVLGKALDISGEDENGK